MRAAAANLKSESDFSSVHFFENDLCEVFYTD